MRHPGPRPGHAPAAPLFKEGVDLFPVGSSEVAQELGGQVAVAFGQQVQQGEKIGYVGSTGLSIGAHLHFQLEVGGMPTDPGPLAGCSGYTSQALAATGPAT